MAPPTIRLSYIRVRAVVWECGEGQTGRQTHIQTHRQVGWLVGWSLTSLFSTNTAISETKAHRRPWPMYTSPRLRLTRHVISRTVSTVDRSTDERAQERLTLPVGYLGVVVLLDEVDVAEVQNSGDDVKDVLLDVRRQTHHRHRMLQPTHHTNTQIFRRDLHVRYR